MLNGHGNDWYNTDINIVGDFSSNIPYINNADVIIKHLKNTVSSIKRYPDPNNNVLRKKISEHHKVSDKNIIVTNGSSEAFYLIAQFFTQLSSLIIIPSFAEYTDATKVFKHNQYFDFLDNINYNKKIKQDIVWLANPNNPDGRIILPKDIATFAVTNNNKYIVLDLAYSFLHPSIDYNYLSKGIKNIISVHSLTKSFAIPGVRIGYIIANEEIINGINSIRVPWSVSAMASASGEFIMDNYYNLLPDVTKLIIQSKRMQQEINRIPYLNVVSSDCNFFITKMEKGNSQQLKNFLLYKYGLLIRDASNFKGLDNTFFRLSVQKRNLNKLIANALNDYFDNINKQII